MFSRQVNHARRVGLPQRMSKEVLGNEPPKAVWTPAGNADRTVMLRRCTDKAAPRGRRWVSQVTSVWQVPMPANMMDELDLDVGDWVYLQAGSDQQSIRLTPAAAVRITLLERPSKRKADR